MIRKRVVCAFPGIALLVLLPFTAAAADTLVHLRYGDRDRTYLVHEPPGISRPVPLVMALHGGGGDAQATVKMSGLNPLADQAGFIVVYPNGTDQVRPLLNLAGKPGFLTWNAGSCCGYALENHVDDAGFLRTVIQKMEGQYRIDPHRIYVTGISNGAMMAYTLACKSGDLVAAVGIVSGIVTDPDCQPAHPVSVIAFHGTADHNIPIDGGVGSKAFIKDKRPPVQDSIDFWIKADACNPHARVSRQSDVDIKRYDDCADRTAVTYYIIQGGGHSWPGGERLSVLLDAPSQAINATQVMWEFFAAHPKPERQHDSSAQTATPAAPPQP